MTDPQTQEVLQLFVRHKLRIKGVIVALLPDFAAAEDVLQETFLVVQRKASEFDRASNFLAWAFRIARLQVMKAQTAHQRHVERLSDAVLESLAASAPVEPWDDQRLALLHETLQQGLGGESPDSRIHRPAGWFAWRQLIAAAAGLAVGLFSATVVFAYVVPKTPLNVTKALPLVDAGVESGTQVPEQGIPACAGAWSGDFSRVVVTENSITPKQGRQMLRMLRADHELSSKNSRNYVGSVALVIDLHPLRSELSDSEHLVEVSAQFNAIQMPQGGLFGFNVKAVAFRGDISDAPRLWENHQSSVAEFPGHYVDQIEVLLTGPANAWALAHNAKGPKNPPVRAFSLSGNFSRQMVAACGMSLR